MFFKIKYISCCFESMKIAFFNVITTSTYGFSTPFTVVFFFIWVFSSSYNFFRLDGCLWIFINLMSLKQFFLSWLLQRLKGWRLFELEGNRFCYLNWKLILATARIVSWIKFCGYYWKYKSFSSLPKHFFLTLLLCTMVKIRLASVKGILILYCFWWEELNGTHLRVSVLLQNMSIQMLLVLGSLFIMIWRNGK